MGNPIPSFVPERARRLSIDENQFTHDRLSKTLEQLSPQVKDDERAYFMFKNIPVVIGHDINREEALHNFNTSMRHKDRMALGERWTSAMAQFRQFLKLVKKTTRK